MAGTELSSEARALIVQLRGRDDVDAAGVDRREDGQWRAWVNGSDVDGVRLEREALGEDPESALLVMMMRYHADDRMRPNQRRRGGD